MSEHEEPDLNEPARPLYAETEGGERIEIPRTKRDVLAVLTTEHGEGIPAAVLAAHDITNAEYATWRMELRAIKLPGGAIRFRESDLETWLGEHETGATVREVSATRADRAGGASVRSLTSRLSATPPHDAATTEED